MHPAKFPAILELHPAHVQSCRYPTCNGIAESRHFRLSFAFSSASPAHRLLLLLGTLCTFRRDTLPLLILPLLLPRHLRAAWRLLVGGTLQASVPAFCRRLMPPFRAVRASQGSMPAVSALSHGPHDASDDASAGAADRLASRSHVMLDWICLATSYSSMLEPISRRSLSRPADHLSAASRAGELDQTPRLLIIRVL